MTERGEHIRIIIVMIMLVVIGMCTYNYKCKPKESAKEEIVENVKVQAKVPEYISKQDVIDVMEKARVDLINEAGGREPDSGAIRLAQLQKAHEFIKDTYKDEIIKHISPNENEINAEFEKLKKNNIDISDDILKEMAKSKVTNDNVDKYIAFMLDTISKEVE